MSTSITTKSTLATFPRVNTATVSACRDGVVISWPLLDPSVVRKSISSLESPLSVIVLIPHLVLEVVLASSSIVAVVVVVVVESIVSSVRSPFIGPFSTFLLSSSFECLSSIFFHLI